MENMNAAAGLQAKLAGVKAQLKLGKDAYNSFAKYSYRNAEAMLAQINPALAAVGATIDFSDEVVAIGQRYYIRTTLTAHDTETGESYAVTAYAREQAEKKGMDEAQISGSAMTYAHKYALMGMFSLADPKADPDAHDNRTSGGRSQSRNEVMEQAPAYPDPAAYQEPAYYQQAPAYYPEETAYYDAAPAYYPQEPQAYQAPAQPQQPQDGGRQEEIPDGTYAGARVTELREVTRRNGKQAMKVTFDVGGGATCSRTIPHGYGMCERFRAALGCPGMSTEQAAAECAGSVYTIEKRRSARDPKYYEIDILSITG